MPVIHIGVPRTATTTLQRAVFAKHPGIHYLGKPFRRKNPTEDCRTRLPAEVITAVWSMDSLGFDAQASKRELDSAFEPNAASDRTVVLSEEALSAAGSADRRLIAERLRRLFGPSDILITIRNQDTALPSLYHHYLRKGLIPQAPFETWLTSALAPKDFADNAWSWIIPQYRYFELYRLYRTVFPDARIKVLLYEEMVEDRAAFCRELSGFLGVDAEMTHELLNAAAKQNESLSYRAVQRERSYRSLEWVYGRLRARLFPSLGLRTQAPALWMLKEKARERAIESSPKLSADGNPAAMSPQARDRLRACYAEDNRRLAEATGLPLERYGYPVSSVASANEGPEA